MTCPTCTPAKRCESCERVAILDAFDFTEPGASRFALSALDAHDRARLAAPETLERVARALHDADDACPSAWEFLDGEVRKFYFDQARVSIAAITEAK